MPILTVNNKQFVYPDPGDEPGWGEGATDWAEEVTTLLAGIFGPGDFLESSFSLPANSTGNLAGILFNTSEVTGLTMSFKASSSLNAEKGKIELIYNPNNAINSRWSVGQESVGELTGVTFSVTDAGQLQYETSSDSVDIRIETISSLT